MDIYLIRHGETVDNVAGLYAGVRDSALTNHGTAQAERLGAYFACPSPTTVEKSSSGSEKDDTTRKDIDGGRDGSIAVHFTHIFASPLSRARKTAEAVRQAQVKRFGGEELVADVELVIVPDLIEQNFGYYEGKSFQARSDPKKMGREADAEERRGEAGVGEAESKAAMDVRADRFLDEHLMPLFGADATSGRMVVAVVSHGMLLSRLWKRFLARWPAKSVIVAPEVKALRGAIILEHPGGWSNTGYMQLSLHRIPPIVPLDLAKAVEEASEVPETIPIEDEAARPTTPPTMYTGSARRISGWTLTIMGIDRKAHLTGLKRQRGGIGSLAFDNGQKKLDGFFKRQRKV